MLMSLLQECGVNNNMDAKKFLESHKTLVGRERILQDLVGVIAEQERKIIWVLNNLTWKRW